MPKEVGRSSLPKGGGVSGETFYWGKGDDEELDVVLP